MGHHRFSSWTSFIDGGVSTHLFAFSKINTYESGNVFPVEPRLRVCWLLPRFDRVRLTPCPQYRDQDIHSKIFWVDLSRRLCPFLMMTIPLMTIGNESCSNFLVLRLSLSFVFRKKIRRSWSSWIHLGPSSHLYTKISRSGSLCFVFVLVTPILVNSPSTTSWSDPVVYSFTPYYFFTWLVVEVLK